MWGSRAYCSRLNVVRVPVQSAVEFSRFMAPLCRPEPGKAMLVKRSPILDMLDSLLATRPRWRDRPHMSTSTE